MTYGVGYDYCSVMHYGPTNSFMCRIAPIHNFTCAVNGHTVDEVGQRYGLSELDIEEVNKRYNCGGKLIVVVLRYLINK